MTSAGGTSNASTTNPATGGSATGGTSSSQTTPVTACSAVTKGDVTLSVPSGTFQGTLELALSTTIGDSEIRYTTDGKDPTSSSTLYSSSISLTRTTRIRAAAFVNGSLAGIGTTAIYVARAADVNQSHDIPVIVLDSYGSGKLPTSYQGERPFVDVAFLAFESDGNAVTIGDTPTVASLAGFHVRGNSSASFDKTPYRIELRAENGSDRDCPLLGMPSESDWAFVGPHADKTLIHNNFVYELGRDMGLQAPRVKLAEVYINVDDSPLSADDYQGVYQIVETIKNQKNRLDLKQLDETKTAESEITGGYIFKTEWGLEPEVAEAEIPCPDGTTKPWNWMELVDPMPVVAPQMDYLKNHLASFHNALHGSNPADANSGYPSYIEVRSFVDTVIINELTRSLDAYARSQYYHKDRGLKINAGPLWDFDLIAGVGIGTTYANLAADGWQYESNAARLGGSTSGGTPGGPGGGMGPSVDWFPLLVADSTFRAQLVARWKELRQNLLSDSAIASRIDGLANGLSAAANRNFAKWSILASKNVGFFETPTDATWAGQLSYMKTWLQNRAAWLDTQWR